MSVDWDAISDPPRYYNMDGEPISLREWVSIFEGETDDLMAGRHVARTETDEILVSTVLLGTNHNYGEGPPLIFETMIFGGEHNEYQDRYATKEEALEGHDRACRLAFGDNPPESDAPELPSHAEAPI